MRKFNFFCSIVMTIVLPLMIVLLSSNLVLRTSELYKFHFNDSQVMDDITFNITGEDMAGTIASYWSAPSLKKIQVYEKNGTYRDPVFYETEQAAMEKAKIVINLALVAGIICLIITLIIYIYFLKKNFREVLRKRFWIGSGITALFLIGQGVCWCLKSFRLWMYKVFINVDLIEDSVIGQVLGDPFYKTYVIFASVLGVAILACLIYANHLLTKPDRIFY